MQIFWDRDQLEALDLRPRADPLGTSATDGTCTFEVEASPKWLYAWTVAPGLTTMRLAIELEAAGTADLGTVTLEPGGRIRGVVRDVAGHVLAGTRLVVADTKADEPLLTPKADGGPYREAPRALATTDDHGEFLIEGAPVGSFSVWAHHESTHWQGRSKVVVAAARETAGLTFALEPLPEERVLEGHVLAPDGRPIEGARVRTSVADPATRGQHIGSAIECAARTNASGHFRIYLAFAPEGVLSLDTEDPSGRFGEVYSEVAPGARDLEIRMLALRELTLVVLDMRGEPIEDFGWGLEIDHGSASVHTGELPAHRASGKATLKLPEAPFTIEMRAPGYGDLEFGPYAPGACPNPLEVRLPALPVARGTVTFEGRPTAGALVELVCPDPQPFGELVPGFELGTFYSSENATITDSEGRFAIPNDFPHLRWHARASKRGHGESKPVRIEIGGESVVLELRRACALVGTVRPGDGVVPQQLRLDLRRSLRAPSKSGADLAARPEVTPDADGHFAFDSLAPGPWLLFVRRFSSVDQAEDDPLPFLVHVKDDTQRFDIDLSAEARFVLDGRLEVDGHPIRTLVRIYSIEEPWLLLLESFSEFDGHFRVGVRQPGTYRLAVQALRESRLGATDIPRTALDVVELSRPETAWIRSVDAASWARGGVRFAFR